MNVERTALLQNQAEVVPGRNRRQDDPAAGTAGMSKRAGSTVIEVKGSHAVHKDGA